MNKPRGSFEKAAGYLSMEEYLTAIDLAVDTNRANDAFAMASMPLDLKETLPAEIRDALVERLIQIGEKGKFDFSPPVNSLLAMVPLQYPDTAAFEQAAQLINTCAIHDMDQAVRITIDFKMQDSVDVDQSILDAASNVAQKKSFHDMFMKYDLLKEAPASALDLK